MKDSHCSQAVLNAYGRCIADCHCNWEYDFEHDCKGVDRERESNLKIAGREYQIGGRFKENGT